jgi:L-alanine-DL-glutamate epimerase-like enolase superfamily enzyme
MDAQMIDAHQTWETQEATTWIKELAEFNPTWIEEPTSPDDVLGHAKIAQVFQTSFCLMSFIYFFHTHFSI